MKRSLSIALLLGLAAMVVSSPAAFAQVNGKATGGTQCYINGKFVFVPSGGCPTGGGGNNSRGRSQPSDNSAANAAAAAAAEAERARQLEIERQRQQEIEAQIEREREEAKRRQEEFERKKQEALSSIKGIAEGELGLKGPGAGDLGLKDLGEMNPGGLGLKSVGSSPPPAWDVQITNPQIAKIAKGLDSIHVPPPLPRSEASLSWKSLSLDGKSADTAMKVGDYLLEAWDLTETLGEKGSLYTKVLFIGGKVFIAGEDGAYVYLVKQNKVYEDALRYLKDPAMCHKFVELEKILQAKGHVPESADPNMLRAARAILNPALGNSSQKIAWDSMLSPEARAAMVRKACLEIGTELVSTGVSNSTEELFSDVTKRKELYEAVRLQRGEAQKMLKHTTDSLDKDQLQKVIAHGNSVLNDIYQFEKIMPGLAANTIGDATGELAAIHIPGDGESPSQKTHSQQR
jgi:hypothetical protein